MTKAPFLLRGWHVLAALVLFFASVIAVNLAFAIIAFRSFPGEDVARSYLQGLRYNETLAERRAAAALGWGASVGLAPDGAGGGVVVVELSDRLGAPLPAARVTGELERPTDSRLDRALAFAPAGPGRHVARAPDLPIGRWRLRARAQDGAGETFDFESELIWRGPR